MMRMLFSMGVLAVSLAPASLASVVWDRGPGAEGGGGIRGYAVNSYLQTGGTFADPVPGSTFSGSTFSGYVHYSNTFSTDPGYYRMRIWSDNGYVASGWNLGWDGGFSLIDEMILTAANVEYLGDSDAYQQPRAPVYKITFGFGSISLPDTVTWDNGWVVPLTYFIGLTSASSTGDAGQWFLAEGGVITINSAAGFGGTCRCGYQAYQLLGTVDSGSGIPGSVPEPATLSVVGLGLACVAGLRRAASRAGKGGKKRHARLGE